MQLEMLSIVYSYWYHGPDSIPRAASIRFHIALVHVLIIDDDINTTGTSNLSC